MTAQVMAIRETSPASASRPTIYGAIGLLGDPFPLEPMAGAYVPLTGQAAVLAGVRDWLGSTAGESAGLGVIAGEPGSGKTRLLEQLVLAIADDDRLIGVLPDEGPRRSDAHLLRSAIIALGGNPGGRTGLELTNELRSILDAHREDPLPPVLLIDNAALTGSHLEILRGVLTRPEAGAGQTQTRVQTVLFGPPALPDRIARRRSLADQTRYVAAMPPLDARAAETLLTGRIEAVRDPGRADMGPLLTDDAPRVLFDASGGNPALLLALAHAAVREAIAFGRSHVNAATARAVADVMPGPGGTAGHVHRTTSAEPVIQTRLSLPGVEVAAEPAPPTARRRGQQR